MMKEKLYDIMSDYNEILKDIDAFVNVLEIELRGVETNLCHREHKGRYKGAFTPFKRYSNR